jgi:hypothetical protein
VGPHNFWQAQKTRSNVKGVVTSALDFPMHVTNRGYGRRDSRPHVNMARNEPRPTRQFHFEWKTFPKMIRIILIQGQRRKVEWTGLDTMVGPKVLQPTNFNSMSGPSVSDSILVVEAQELEPSDPDYLADPIEK